MIYLIVFAVFAAVWLLALRIHIRRDEKWLAEQARLDAEARRERLQARAGRR